MHEAKNTQRALVRISFDGKVHKLFRGPDPEARFENEVKVLKYLEKRECPFVPRLLESHPESLEIVTSNCGTRVERLPEEKITALFQQLEEFGVRHEDPYLRNITYRASDGRFCLIDFEFATIIGPALSDKELEIENQSELLASSVTWSGWTDRGKVRPNNEDAFLILRLDADGVRYLGKQGQSERKDEQYIFAVSDGMGGERSGEFASRIALEKITSRLPLAFDLSEDRFAVCASDILHDLFVDIHRAMLDLGRYDANCEDMGATLTLAWLRNDRLYFGHLGDCRLYLSRVSASGQAELQQLTEDHTHVGWLRRKGEINERESRMHPRKNDLTQALGSGHRTIRPQFGHITVQPNDRFLICSDGVTDGLWEARVSEFLALPLEYPKSKSELLVEESVSASGRDNATAITVEFDA